MNQNNILNEIQERMLKNEIRESFSEKGFSLKEITINEYNDNNTVVTILTLNGDKLLVEKHDKKISWKLNALLMGEVIGKEICDVAASYEYERNKDRR